MTVTTTFPAPSRAADSAAIVARNLKRLMVERDVKQGQLAAVLGVSQSNVSKRLKGRTPFTTDDLDALAQAFGVRPGDLLEDDTQADDLQNEAARTPVGARAAEQLPRLDSNQQPADCGTRQLIAGFRTRIGSRRPGYVGHHPAHDRLLHSVDTTASTQVKCSPTFDGVCVESDREVA